LFIFKRSSIQTGIDLLVKKQAIEVHRNPVLKYDNTRHFLFRPEVLAEWLKDHRLNSAVPPAENSGSITENSLPSAENSATIPEVSTEKPTDTKTKGGSRSRASHTAAPDRVVVASLVSKEEKDFRAFLATLKKEFGLSDKQGKEVESYIPEPGEGYIREKAEVVRSKPRKNLAGTFLKALSDDWKSPRSSEPAKRERRPAFVQKEFQELSEEEIKKGRTELASLKAKLKEQ